MSFNHLQKKIKKKKIGIWSGSVIPEADPDPHQIEADPKHCKKDTRKLKKDLSIYSQLVILRKPETPKI